jgi:hypothetical protein
MPVANLPLPSALDEDELPGSFLDGPFDAFDDTTLLGTFETCAVTDAPPMAFYEVDTLPATLKRPAPFRLQPSREMVNPLDSLVDELAA